MFTDKYCNIVGVKNASRELHKIWDRVEFHGKQTSTLIKESCDQTTFLEQNPIVLSTSLVSLLPDTLCPTESL